MRNPRQLGALTPSGKSLANAMASCIDTENDSVIELGPGTGSITRAIIEKGLPLNRLLLLEKDPQFAQQLALSFPGVRLEVADASELQSLTLEPIMPKVNKIVSSLPLLSIRPDVRKKIIEQIFLTLEPDGQLIQFTYSPFAPLTKELLNGFNVTGERMQTVFKNIPPAFIWSFRKQ